MSPLEIVKSRQKIKSSQFFISVSQPRRALRFVAWNNLRQGSAESGADLQYTLLWNAHPREITSHTTGLQQYASSIKEFINFAWMWQQSSNAFLLHNCFLSGCVLRGNTISSLSVKRGEKWYRTRTTPAEISRCPDVATISRLYRTRRRNTTSRRRAIDEQKRPCDSRDRGKGEQNPRKKTKIFSVYLLRILT